MAEQVIGDALPSEITADYDVGQTDMADKEPEEEVEVDGEGGAGETLEVGPTSTCSVLSTICRTKTAEPTLNLSCGLRKFRSALAKKTRKCSMQRKHDPPRSEAMVD